MGEALSGFIAGFIVLNAVSGIVTYVTLLERKFAARVQSRIGPYRVGPHGLLQPIADALKLLMKEDIVPRLADRGVYNLAPLVFPFPRRPPAASPPAGSSSPRSRSRRGSAWRI